MLRQTHESRDVKVWLLCCEKTCSSSWLFFHIGRSPHSDNPFIILDKDKLTKYKTPFLNDDFIDFGQKMIQTHLYESTCLESWVHFHYPHSGVATLLPQSRNSLNRNLLKKWSRLTDLKSNTSGHYLPQTTDIIHKRRNCGPVVNLPMSRPKWPQKLNSSLPPKNCRPHFPKVRSEFMTPL